MGYRRFLAGFVALAGCAHAYASPTLVKTSTAPGVVFDCVKQQLGVLGYKQSSIDTDALRVNATKIEALRQAADYDSALGGPHAGLLQLPPLGPARLSVR